MCANVTTQINAIVTARDGAWWIASDTGISSAHGNITAKRDDSTDRPRATNRPLSHPPNSAPRSAERYGIHASIPISTIVKPRCSTRYFGSQKR